VGWTGGEWSGLEWRWVPSSGVGTSKAGPSVQWNAVEWLKWGWAGAGVGGRVGGWVGGGGEGRSVAWSESGNEVKRSENGVKCLALGRHFLVLVVISPFGVLVVVFGGFGWSPLAPGGCFVAPGGQSSLFLLVVVSFSWWLFLVIDFRDGGW
jgi:hypothetical protein